MRRVDKEVIRKPSKQAFQGQKNNPRKHYAFLGLFFIRTFAFSNALHYNEAITRKGAVFMKEKRYVTLSDYERRVIVLSLNRLRNRVIADGIDPIDVDRMLLKMTRLQKARFRRA